MVGIESRVREMQVDWSASLLCGHSIRTEERPSCHTLGKVHEQRCCCCCCCRCSCASCPSYASCACPSSCPEYEHANQIREPHSGLELGHIRDACACACPSSWCPSCDACACAESCCRRLNRRWSTPSRKTSRCSTSYAIDAASPR